jgi:hypothetical protein
MEEFTRVKLNYDDYVKSWNENKHYKGVSNLMSIEEWYNHRIIVYRQLNPEMYYPDFKIKFAGRI